jgi:hypothetical protein
MMDDKERVYTASEMPRFAYSFLAEDYRKLEAQVATLTAERDAVRAEVNQCHTAMLEASGLVARLGHERDEAREEAARLGTAALEADHEQVAAELDRDAARIERDEAVQRYDEAVAVCAIMRLWLERAKGLIVALKGYASVADPERRIEQVLGSIDGALAPNVGANLLAQMAAMREAIEALLPIAVGTTCRYPANCERETEWHEHLRWQCSATQFKCCKTLQSLCRITKAGALGPAQALATDAGAALLTEVRRLRAIEAAARTLNLYEDFAHSEPCETCGPEEPGDWLAARKSLYEALEEAE